MPGLRIITAFIFAVLPLITTAATLIESRDKDGTTSTIYIDQGKARFETPDNDGYMVIDIDRKTMYFIIHPEKTVIDMSKALQSNKTSTTIKQPAVELRAKGNGPTLHGYPTKEYEEYSNGTYCGSVITSIEATNDLGIGHFVKAFTIMLSEINNLFSDITGDLPAQFIDQCEMAETSLANNYNEIGFPLKSLDKQQQMDTLVTKINKNAKIPGNAFDLPENYKLTTADGFLQEVMQQVPEEVQQLMKDIPPETLEMMKQLPPEMLDMMKKQMQGQQ